MANIVENEINLSHNLKNDMRLKDMHIDKVATNKLSKNNITNNIKITPYFEETVNKKELDPTVMTFKENILKIKGPATPKKQLNRQQLKFMKKFKVIRERIKRHMHDDNLYRNDTTAKELEGHHPLLKRALSIDNASIGEFRQARMLEIRKLFGRHEKDTGSPAIVACALNEKVMHMVSHLRSNPTDKTTFIRLNHAATKRRKYMMYLRKVDYNTYSYILRYYGIKDFPEYNINSDRNWALMNTSK